jgi:hypothetical protein
MRQASSIMVRYECSDLLMISSCSDNNERITEDQCRMTWCDLPLSSRSKQRLLESGEGGDEIKQNLIESGTC